MTKLARATQTLCGERCREHKPHQRIMPKERLRAEDAKKGKTLDMKIPDGMPSLCGCTTSGHDKMFITDDENENWLDSLPGLHFIK